jgi:hypothetical protein
MTAVILLTGSMGLAASQLDQQQTDTSSNVCLDADFPQAQTFTAGVSGSIDKIDVHARLFGSSKPGDLLVSIQTLDNSGIPSGTVLGSGSMSVGDFVVGAPADWVEVTLAQPASVVSGTKYALVVSTANPGQGDDWGCYFWSAGTNDPYSGGDPLGRNQAGGWFFRGSDDFAFKTFVAVPDTTAPNVKRVVPSENATEIGPGANVHAFFSEAMRGGSINPNTVKLYPTGSTTALAATVTYDASRRKAILDPSAPLVRGKRYKAVVTMGARDLAGNQLDQDTTLDGLQPKAWFFTVRN